MAEEFGASLALAQWVVLAYVLCITGLLLPAGRLADILGRKEVFLAGFVIFAAGSAMCGLSPTIEWLITARVVQGVGGAMVQANSGALVTQAFPASERGRALGLVGSWVSLGLLSGPLVGGVITEYAGWRWAFYVNVLITAVATPAGWRLLRPSPVARGQRFDPAGAALFFVAVGALMLGINPGPHLGLGSTPAPWGCSCWPSARGRFSCGSSGASRSRRSIWPCSRNWGFAAAVGAGFLSFMASASAVLLMPFYFRLVLGLRSDQTGLLLVATPRRGDAPGAGQRVALRPLRLPPDLLAGPGGAAGRLHLPPVPPDGGRIAPGRPASGRDRGRDRPLQLPQQQRHVRLRPAGPAGPGGGLPGPHPEPGAGPGADHLRGVCSRSLCWPPPVSPGGP